MLKKKEAQRIADRIARLMGARKGPRVKLAKLNREGWSGRYDPKSVAVHLKYNQGRNEPDLHKTLLSHELAHWGARLVYCKGNVKAKKCSYKGQHDKRFYKVLKPIHKKLSINRKHAEALEKRAGYSPPDGWLDQAMYMARSKHKQRRVKKSFLSRLFAAAAW
jgi:hypothetical protein